MNLPIDQLATKYGIETLDSRIFDYVSWLYKLLNSQIVYSEILCQIPLNIASIILMYICFILLPSGTVTRVALPPNPLNIFKFLMMLLCNINWLVIEIIYCLGGYGDHEIIRHLILFINGNIVIRSTYFYRYHKTVLFIKFKMEFIEICEFWCILEYIRYLKRL